MDQAIISLQKQQLQTSSSLPKTTSTMIVQVIKGQLPDYPSHSTSSTRALFIQEGIPGKNINSDIYPSLKSSMLHCSAVLFVNDQALVIKLPCKKWPSSYSTYSPAP